MTTTVITGANRGLGLELARRFAAAGHTVIGACRTPTEASELAEVASSVHPLDMGDEASIAAFVLAMGDRTIDVVVNNAGLDLRGLGGDHSTRGVLDQSPEHFLGQMRVNALGPMLLARGLVPNLERSDNGRIVNVSSQVGSMEVGQRIGSDVGYAASKAALNMVTIKLAGALRDRGITAMMIHPGYLRTDMGGSGADLDPADAAAQIVELVDGLTIDDTMTFRRWDGTIHPW